MDNIPAPAPQVYISSPPFYQSKRFIILLFVVFLITIPLSFFILKTFFLNRAEQSTVSPSPSPTPTLLSNPLVAKAKSIGYDIIWIHPDDITGRTVFYQDRNKAEVNLRGTGIIYTKVSSTATQRLISYTAGTFISFQAVANSPDLYVESIDPQTGLSLPKARLILTKDAPTKTFFRVENLAYGPNNPFDSVRNAEEGNLGILSDWTSEDLKKIIKTGDAVVISLISKDKSGNLVNQTDNSREFIGTLVVIRRFDGQKQLEKELQL